METPSEGDDSVNKLPSAMLPQSGRRVLGTDLNCSESEAFAIRNAALTVLAHETDHGPLRRLHKAFFGFEDTADRFAIGQHIEIVLIPFP